MGLYEKNFKHPTELLLTFDSWDMRLIEVFACMRSISLKAERDARLPRQYYNMTFNIDVTVQMLCSEYTEIGLALIDLLIKVFWFMSFTVC